MQSGLDAHVRTIQDLYSSLNFSPQHLQHTIIAAFILQDEVNATSRVISIGTGTKCLPTIRLPLRGEALHDSHAEVLARRGAIRWFLEEIGRQHEPADLSNRIQSDWISFEKGRYTLKEGVQLNLYISTVPCGDASMRYLAAFQDEEMAALKDSAAYSPSDPGSASRGRDNYSLYGVLRTKPGRADSPATLSMSCSDKIARWNFLGVQGALVTRLLRPIYITNVIIGEVPEDMRDVVREDCERALWRRLDSIEGSEDVFHLHRPTVSFTSIPFIHSRTSPSTVNGKSKSCNESICWVADSPHFPEILINGLKRGVSPKHKFREKSRPQLSKISLFTLYNKVALSMNSKETAEASSSDTEATYFAVKQSMIPYQAAKRALLGKSGPFSGWITSGEEWENFNSNGDWCGTQDAPSPSLPGSVSHS